MIVTGEFNFLGIENKTTAAGKEYKNISLLQVEGQSLNKFFVNDEIFAQASDFKPMDLVRCQIDITEGFSNGQNRTYMNLKSITKIAGK